MALIRICTKWSSIFGAFDRKGTGRSLSSFFAQHTDQGPLYFPARVCPPTLSVPTGTVWKVIIKDECKLYQIGKPMQNKVRPLKIIFRSIPETTSFLDNLVTAKLKYGDSKMSVSSGQNYSRASTSELSQIWTWKSYQKWRDKSHNKILE